MMIPKFNINRTEPQPMLNRAFLWQVLISSGQNFTRIAPLIENLYGQRLDNYIPMVISNDPSGQTTNIPDIRGLSNEDVLGILTHEKMDLLPEFFFWFGEKDIAGTNDFMNFPELYTGIEKVSFDKGGLILLKRGKDSKRLFTGQGVPLTDLLQPLDKFYDISISLGIKGLVVEYFHDLIRQDSFDTVYWFNNNSLNKLNVLEQLSGDPSPCSENEKYMDIHGDSFYFHDQFNSGIPRDVIDEMLPEGQKLATGLDVSQSVNEKQLDEELQHNPHAEIFFRYQYFDNKKLAAIVLKYKPIAYSCLSRKLQNDRSFIIEVIKNSKLYALYPFLRRNLRENEEIIALCKTDNPDPDGLPF